MTPLSRRLFNPSLHGILSPMRAVLIFALFGLTLCDRDETATGYGAADRGWVLSELDGRTFAAHATLSFPAQGAVAGEGPCNRFSGTLAVPYPWFDIGQLMSTSRACPDANAETAYFSALQAMTEIEISGALLVLRNAEGREMVFTASD